MECLFENSGLGCNCNNCPCKKDADLGAIIKFKPEITYNTNRVYPSGKKAPDGIEIRFGLTRPTEQVREMLKAHGFKFSEKQTLWYAFDNAKSREMATYFQENEVDADDTQYEKRHFWTKVGSLEFYKKLTNYTEFMLKTEPPRFFRSKNQLEKAVSNPSSYIFSDMLRFKKFYNKVVGEDGEEKEPDGSEDEAEEGGEGSEERETKPLPKPDNSINLQLAEKFRNLADGMKKQIEAKLNSATSRQRPTAKRLRVAASMRSDGYRLKNIQVLLYALSHAHKSGNIKEYDKLQNITSRSQVELLNRYADEHGRKQDDALLQSAFKHNKDSFAQLNINSVFDWSLAYSQRGELINSFSPEAIQRLSENEIKLQELELHIKGLKIPGFFPTPKSLTDLMVQWADLKLSDTILEPSAGKGDILMAVKNIFGNQVVKLDAIELNHSLREFLTLKGFQVVGHNFLDFKEKSYDKILMNPPFENGQDIDHVLHALDLLKSGGRVVAIMSEGVFFRQFKKETAFRDLLADKNAFVSEPIKGAFKDAFNQTGVNVRMVVINEDGSYPELPEEEDETEEESEDMETESTQKDSDNSEDTELLELEAQAELELLKIQVELERKKKRDGLTGLEGNNETKAEKLDRLKQMAKDLPLLPDAWDIK